MNNARQGEGFRGISQETSRDWVVGGLALLALFVLFFARR